VADRVDMTVADGIQKPTGDPLSGLRLAVVNRRNDPVSLREHVIWQVHPSIFKDV
jgi:hypothetical protein